MGPSDLLDSSSSFLISDLCRWSYNHRNDFRVPSVRLHLPTVTPHSFQSRPRRLFFHPNFTLPRYPVIDLSLHPCSLSKGTFTFVVLPFSLSVLRLQLKTLSSINSLTLPPLVSIPSGRSVHLSNWTLSPVPVFLLFVSTPVCTNY